jgi:hypothetical protein
MTRTVIWMGLWSFNDNEGCDHVEARSRAECEVKLRDAVAAWRTANPTGIVDDAWITTERLSYVDRDYPARGIVTARTTREAAKVLAGLA